MPSKKKNRGKQRKAQAAALKSYLDLQEKHARYKATFLTHPPASVVDEIRRGKDLPTQAVVQLSGTDHEDIMYRQRLVDEGMVEAVLSLLKRCKDETFQDVLVDIGGKDGDGGLPFPSVWLNVLFNTIAHENMPSQKKMDECRLLIADNIGPLVECMIGNNREFYKENMQWHNSIVFFVALLRNLILTKETAPILLRYEGLADFVIQSLFWEEHRPDIVEESKKYGTFVMPDVFSKITEHAGYVVEEFVNVGKDGVFNKEEMQRLDFLARTSIVSKDAPDNCGTATFAVGLVRALNSNTSSIDKEHLFWILNQFASSSCIDKHVIQGIVDYGSSIDTCEYANDILVVLYNTVMPPTKGVDAPVPKDSLFGIVIAAGFFEMCVRMALRFGSYLDKAALNQMLYMMHGASAVALLKKSSEAIASRRSTVLAMLESTETDQVNDKCEEILQMIRSVVQSSDGSEKYKARAFCRQCYKLLEDDAIRRCSKCKRATYCSRACQQEDWHAEHKRDCKHMTTHGMQVKNTGHNKRDVKKAEKHEKNVSLAGARAFSEKLHTIMLRAILQGYSIIDCVVCIDLFQIPPSIEVKLAADFLFDCRKNSADEYDHIKRIISRNKYNGAITCACHSLGVYGGTNAAGTPATAVLMKTFPAVSAPHGSWTVYQQRMEIDLPESFEAYKYDSDLREEFFRDL